jgi:hypothetical protein
LSDTQIAAFERFNESEDSKFFFFDGEEIPLELDTEEKLEEIKAVLEELMEPDEKATETPTPAEKQKDATPPSFDDYISRRSRSWERSGNTNGKRS